MCENKPKSTDPDNLNSNGINSIPVEAEVSVPTELLKESSFLLHKHGAKSCPNWKEGVGDCGDCEACRVFKCIDLLDDLAH